MSLIKKTDNEILEIASPLWDSLVKHSNSKDYYGFTKDFSARMLMGANEPEIAKGKIIYKKVLKDEKINLISEDILGWDIIYFLM